MRTAPFFRAVLERGSRRSSRASRIALAVLCLLVLTTSVDGGFASVRVRLSPGATVSGGTEIPLAAARRIREPYIVAIYRARNTGALPVTVTASAGSRVLERSTIRSGDSVRVDLVWDWSGRGTLPVLVLEGTHADWRLESVELANRHGFTRGLVEFLILPHAQPFPRAATWLYGLCSISLLLLVLTVPKAFPREVRLLHLLLSGLFIALFGAAAVSAVLTPFRIVLAEHTVAFGVSLMVAPRVVALGLRGWPFLARAAVEAFRVLMRGVRAGIQAATLLPWRQVVTVFAVGAYAWLVWTNAGAYAGGADQSGYLNAARLLSDGRTGTAMRGVPGVPLERFPPEVYSPLGFRPVDSGRIAPTYPIGVPLVVAAAGRFAALDSAAHHVVAVFALAGVLLCLWLARLCGLSHWGALLAAFLLATSPLYLFMSLQLMSDTPSLVWVTASLLFAWQSRQRPLWALAAGLTLALAVLTRPPNILALAPIAVALGVSSRRWLWLVAGGLPGAALLLRFNLLAYGASITTGYGDLSGLFGTANVAASLVHYATYLPVLLTPIGVLALGLPWLLRREPAIVTMLLAWIVVFLALYAFYFYTYQAWWFLRFVLPAFPPLIVGALLVARELLDRTRVVARVRQGWRPLPAMAGVLLTVVVLAHNAWWGRQWFVVQSGRGERVYADAAAWARQHLPPQSMVLAMQVSGAFFYYTDFVVLRWDFLDKAALGLLQDEARAGRRPLYAVLFPFEIEERQVFAQRLHGPWTMVGAVEHVTFWRFDGGAPVDPQAH